MSDYHARARSNYFRVNDVDAFRTALARYNFDNLQVVVEHGTDDIVVVLADELGFIDGEYTDSTTGATVEVSVASIIAQHLADDWVCILQQIGSEDLRYLTGHAVAFNNRGDEVAVNLSDIFALAGHLGTQGAAEHSF